MPSSSSSRIPDWIQIAANLATVAAVFYAAVQLTQAATDARIANSVKILEQGLQVQSDYQEGKVQPRNVISYYYEIFLLRQSNRLLDDLYAPLNRSMCTFMQQDPRAREYWQGAQKGYWDPRFVELIDHIQGGGSCD